MSFSASVYEACKVSPRIFVMHPGYKRTNFYAQQLRALALVREMVASGDLSDDAPSLIVVGGGVAGLTAAAAALTARAMVTLIERVGYLAEYKEAAHRELHPNLIAWPFQVPKAMTTLPFLNWACGPADRVADDLTRQWQKDFARHASAVKDTVTELVETKDKVEVICQHGQSRVADIVLMAVGWERERIGGKSIGPNYWRPQPFDDGEIVVSGSGDGGLIDLAYQTYGQKTVSVSRMLAYILERKPHRDWIRKAEEAALKSMAEAGDQAQRDAAFEQLQVFYDKLTMEDEDSRLLATYRRPQPLKARLIHENRTAFSPFAAPINKVLLSTLTKPPAEAARLERGTVTLSSEDKLVKASTGAPEELDDRRIIIRHGAAPAALQGSLLSDKHKDMLAQVPIGNLAQVVPDEYDYEFFTKQPARPIAPLPILPPRPILRAGATAGRKDGEIHLRRQRDLHAFSRE